VLPLAVEMQNVKFFEHGLADVIVSDIESGRTLRGSDSSSLLPQLDFLLSQQKYHQLCYVLS
jgi:hypothetical protein